jgi:hypothetical protein
MDQEKKVGPSDFQAEVARLQAEGKMPELEDILDAVADARKKFSSKILKARAQGSDHEAGVNALG